MSKIQHELTRQYKLYEEYLKNPNKSIKELAEEFNITYKTANVMIFKERKRRGIKKERY